jgi:hypothetical protein
MDEVSQKSKSTEGNEIMGTGIVEVADGCELVLAETRDGGK